MDYPNIKEIFANAKYSGLFSKKFCNLYSNLEKYKYNDLVLLRAMCQNKLSGKGLATNIIPLAMLVTVICTSILSIYNLMINKIPIEDIRGDELNSSIDIMAFMTSMILIVTTVWLISHIYGRTNKYKALLYVCQAHIDKIEKGEM